MDKKLSQSRSICPIPGRTATIQCQVHGAANAVREVNVRNDGINHGGNEKSPVGRNYPGPKTGAGQRRDGDAAVSNPAARLKRHYRHHGWLTLPALRPLTPGGALSKGVIGATGRRQEDCDGLVPGDCAPSRARRPRLVRLVSRPSRLAKRLQKTRERIFAWGLRPVHARSGSNQARASFFGILHVFLRN
jgi:hypothetical protein